MADIQKALEERILILDGAMGTMIQAYRLEESDFRGKQFEDHDHPLKGNNDLLSLTRPDIIHDIHMQFLDAGADIIETNTFSGTSIAQADYGLEDVIHELNKKAAEIAKEAALGKTEEDPNKPRWVAGAMGPTNKTASLSPDVNDPGYRAITFNELKDAYAEQARGLIDGGVDLLLVETIFDTLNAKAAFFGIQEVFTERNISLPLMASGTITDASGRTLSGQTSEAFLISLSHVPLLSIGFNCALGASQLRPYLKIVARKADFYISAYPNAGLPNEMGEYDQSPEDMKKEVEEYLEEGLVNILGGCCGTTPLHIKAMADAAKDFKPRTLKTLAQ
ncbi:MAG: 5-methyltetrahydrofolate--homocysteine methyltransferase [Flavobacteriales bacterium]|nr:5-methyltetrahydrofolate--homocysteine methyltransferase [Flavobacteriales bacterium]